MKDQQPRIVVNRKPKLRHGFHTIRHPNGEIEKVRLCLCCGTEGDKDA